MEKEVAILMSTYNGEKYISEQIDSILAQKDVKIHLYIRDDGSKDKTVEILSKYIHEYPHLIDLIKGENIGFANSFYSLIKNNYEADYYSFADQDDVWEPDKIITAINHIDKTNPCLYSSNVTIYDKLEGRNELMFKETDFMADRFTNYFYMQNPLGCSMIWNNSLQHNLMKNEKPNSMTHDTWVHIVANCTGNFIYDNQAHMTYRIHPNNSCGTTPKGSLNKIKKYYKRYFIDKKKLQISLSCEYIKKNFPNKYSPIIETFSKCNKNIANRIFALLLISTKFNIPEKKKMLILIAFNKL